MATDQESFQKDVSEYVELDEKLKQATAGIKVIKQRMTDLEDNILDFMESKELDVCHLADGTKLKKASAKRQGPFNAKMVKEVLGGFMEAEKLTEAFGKIEEKRGEYTSVSLKRVKK